MNYSYANRCVSWRCAKPSASDCASVKLTRVRAGDVEEVRKEVNPISLQRYLQRHAEAKRRAFRDKDTDRSGYHARGYVRQQW